MVADKLSRLGQTIQTEWSLLPKVFQAICSRWHQPQIDLFATRFNNKLPQFVLGRSLRSNFYKGSVVRPGKKATHKCSRVEGGFPGPSKLQGPVPEPNSASCNGQLNSGSLHKQTRRNSLSRDVRSPVEDHDMVPSLSHNIKMQTHSRVSECDGRPSVQVEPSSVNRMVTTSNRSVKSGSLLM